MSVGEQYAPLFFVSCRCFIDLRNRRVCRFGFFFDYNNREGRNRKKQELKPKDVGIGYGEGRGNSQNSEYVPKQYKATCLDKKLLPVWNALRKDKEFRERENKFYMNADCSEMFDIKKVDLNGDGQKEFIFWGKNGNLCGATGNCHLWIYEKKNGKYKQLLQYGAYHDGKEEWFEVKKAKTNGYRNLLLKGHFSGYETDHHFFKFNGVKYVERKCWMKIYSLDESGPYAMSCKEFDEKIERELRESESRLNNK